MKPVESSLTVLSEKVGDPTSKIYEKLFQLHPDVVPLFTLDKDDSAKGEMLSQVLSAILDFVDNRQYAQNLIGTELINHSHLGIEPEIFRSFFNIIRDTVRDEIADQWTDEMEEEWEKLIAELDVIMDEEMAGLQ